MKYVEVATVIMDKNENPESFKFGSKLIKVCEEGFIAFRTEVQDGETTILVPECNFKRFIIECIKTP